MFTIDFNCVGPLCVLRLTRAAAIAGSSDSTLQHSDSVGRLSVPRIARLRVTVEGLRVRVGVDTGCGLAQVSPRNVIRQLLWRQSLRIFISKRSDK